MIHYRSFEEVQLEGAWATIGAFDGVHRGHQAILSPMIAQAHAAGAPAAVVTFSPHPVVVLRSIDEPMCLTTPDERAEQLGQLGIDIVITLHFDHALAALTAEEFMRRMSAHLGLRQLWAGKDFALGRGRQGNLAVLSQMGKQMGYQVQVVADILTGDQRISSSQIRNLLREGQVDRAADLLGRPYSLAGEVIHGQGRGRQLGYPTANIAFPEKKILPRYGVYATWCRTEQGERIPSVTSVGVRPTFASPNPRPTVEPYLIDFSRDLYGQSLRVEFQRFLRPELRFDSVQSLINQMDQDTIHAREVLNHAA